MTLTFSEFKKMLSLDDRTEQYELQLSCKGDCNLVGPRQDGKTTIAAAYLLWSALTKPDINIGITSATRVGAMDVLAKMKNLMKNAKMLDLLKVNNKNSVEFYNGARINAEVVNMDSFRGYGINLLYIDEINFVNEKNLTEFMYCILPTMTALKESKLITSAFRGW